tara:strand:- start:10199 stop:10420 length:222 start_codon:yes stop_codon:yes gene_type:complete
MSQKQINHIIDYTNKFSQNVDMNIQFNIEETGGNNTYTLNNDDCNNYGKIYNIAVDIVNSRNSYYLKNISLDK